MHIIILFHTIIITVIIFTKQHLKSFGATDALEEKGSLSDFVCILRINISTLYTWIRESTYIIGKVSTHSNVAWPYSTLAFNIPTSLQISAMLKYRKCNHFSQ